MKFVDGPPPPSYGDLRQALALSIEQRDYENAALLALNLSDQTGVNSPEGATVYALHAVALASLNQASTAVWISENRNQTYVVTP